MFCITPLASLSYLYCCFIHRVIKENKLYKKMPTGRTSFFLHSTWEGELKPSSMPSKGIPFAICHDKNIKKCFCSFHMVNWQCKLSSTCSNYWEADCVGRVANKAVMVKVTSDLKRFSWICWFMLLACKPSLDPRNRNLWRLVSIHHLIWSVLCFFCFLEFLPGNSNFVARYFCVLTCNWACITGLSTIRANYLLVGLALPAISRIFS